MHHSRCSFISCVHLSCHVSSPFISVHAQSIHIHPCHGSINHPPIHQTPFFHFFTRSGQRAIVSGSELSICSLFNKRILQTSVGSSAYPITHLSTTTLLSLSLTALLCIQDERRRLRLHLSISRPAITNLDTQAPSGHLFFCFSFATCQKPVITDSAARHGCEYQSAFSWSLIHLTCTACGRDSQSIDTCRCVSEPQLSSPEPPSGAVARGQFFPPSPSLLKLPSHFKHVLTWNTRFERTQCVTWQQCRIVSSLPSATHTLRLRLKHTPWRGGGGQCHANAQLPQKNCPGKKENYDSELKVDLWWWNF